MRRFIFILCFALSFPLFGAEKETKKEKGEKKEAKSVAKKEEERFFGLKKINDYIPKNLRKKLKVSLEIRHRFEYHENKFDLNDNSTAIPADHDGFQLLRTRLNIDFQPVKMLRLFLQAQDSRLWDNIKPPAPNRNFYEDYVDLRQLYADFILNIGSKGSFILRAGRQELAYGRERLVGGFNWNNVAQSFDGVRAIFKMNKIQFDMFWVRKVNINYNKWNNWDEQDDFYGLYFQMLPVLDKAKKRKHEVHAYLFYRDTSSDFSGPNTPVPAGQQGIGADVDEFTIGFRLSGEERLFSYVLEFAHQFGRAGYLTTRTNIEAYALIAGLWVKCPCPVSPKFGVEINYGSGDNTFGRGRMRTFDNLYPTNHLHYGYMDMFSLQNLFNIILHASAKPTKKLLVKLDMHILFLDSSYDALYNAGRVRHAAYRNPIGVGPEYLGVELDFTLKYKVNKFLSFLAGVSHFWASGILKKVGNNDNAQFAYFQTTFSF